MNALQAVGEYAEAFLPYSDGTAVDEIEALFNRLGKLGGGLNALLQQTPAMGKLFGKYMVRHIQTVVQQTHA